MKLNCWAKAELSAGKYVLKDDPLQYKNHLVFKKQQNTIGTNTADRTLYLQMQFGRVILLKQLLG